LIVKTPNHPDQVRRCVVNRLNCSTVCFCLLLSAATHAQTVYRIVGADGRITFSDKAPVSADSATVMVPGGRTIPLAAAMLPLELRQVVGKYPVTLYSAANCAPCNSGRDLLVSRGVPFAERTVSTNEDSDALQRISGGTSLPLLTIGSQQIKGFSESEWTQFLDAAAYPKSSVLPATYRSPPATPLVVTQPLAPAVQPNETQPPQQTQPAPTVPSQTPSNPAGIRF
jgi:glutaredoxin